MIRALKSGYIIQGALLPKHFRVLSGSEPLKEIYTNIYFDDIPSNQFYWGPTFIIDPSIINSYNIGIRDGWQGYETLVSNSDSTATKKKKFSTIHKKLKSAPTYVYSHDSDGTRIRLKRPLYAIHEIVFRKKIPINKFAIGIVCNKYSCSSRNFATIQRICAEKNYNIKIIFQTDSDEALPLSTFKKI
jgi:hypothetical protein